MHQGCTPESRETVPCVIDSDSSPSSSRDGNIDCRDHHRRLNTIQEDQCISEEQLGTDYMDLVKKGQSFDSS